jgi:hypothetical protein
MRIVSVQGFTLTATVMVYAISKNNPVAWTLGHPTSIQLLRMTMDRVNTMAKEDVFTSRRAIMTPWPITMMDRVYGRCG